MAEKTKKQRGVPGAKWCVRAKAADRSIEHDGPGIFDELVVDDWLHIEQMDVRRWWASIGDARLDIYVSADGRVVINIERGQYGPEDGRTISGKGQPG